MFDAPKKQEQNTEGEKQKKKTKVSREKNLYNFAPVYADTKLRKKKV